MFSTVCDSISELAPYFCVLIADKYPSLPPSQTGRGTLSIVELSSNGGVAIIHHITYTAFSCSAAASQM